MKHLTASYWINRLKLIAHPEGGFFKEVYRAAGEIPALALPPRFKGNRNFSTAIYYLLERGDFSAFHRILADETWHFYDGNPLEIIIITAEGKLNKQIIGLEQPEALPMFTIRAGDWFAARNTGDYTLCGCTVAPGFDFADFELGDYKQLAALFPQHRKLIEQFTRI